MKAPNTNVLLFALGAAGIAYVAYLVSRGIGSASRRIHKAGSDVASFGTTVVTSAGATIDTIGKSLGNAAYDGVQAVESLPDAIRRIAGPENIQMAGLTLGAFARALPGIGPMIGGIDAAKSGWDWWNDGATNPQRRPAYSTTAPSSGRTQTYFNADLWSANPDNVTGTLNRLALGAGPNVFSDFPISLSESDVSQPDWLSATINANRFKTASNLNGPF